jgi:alkylation response protein AidB-like acyl-CoA dehydrogenase
MNVNWIGPAIFTSGTPEQKDEHLKRIASGDVTWCQGFSEQGAGTDLAALSTSAVRDGDDYVINGEKVWTSYAREAEYCFLLARTGPGSAGTTGISIFLVPTSTPGFRAYRGSGRCQRLVEARRLQHPAGRRPGGLCRCADPGLPGHRRSGQGPSRRAGGEPGPGRDRPL